MARYDIPTAHYDIKVRRGSFNSYTMSFTDAAGNPEDMTGFTFTGSIAQTFGGVAVLTFSSDVASIATGIVVMYADKAAVDAMPVGTYADTQQLEDTKYGVFNFEMTDGTNTYRVTEGNVTDSRDAT